MKPKEKTLKKKMKEADYAECKLQAFKKRLKEWHDIDRKHGSK
jgi:DNA repair ATPase RecN